MFSLLCALVLGTSSVQAAPRPVGVPAEQASATSAQRLAAQAHADAQKALRKYDDLSAKEKAELRKISKRMAKIEDGAEATKAEVKRAQARIDQIEARVRKLEQRRTQLIVGAGASGLYATDIPEHVQPLSLSGVADIGINVQNKQAGWSLVGEFGLTPDSGYSLGAYGVAYGRVKGYRKLALGGGATGTFSAYDAFGSPTYSAYRWQAGPTLYARWTVVPRRVTHALPLDLVVRPQLLFGEITYNDTTNFEVSGAVTLTFQGRVTLD